MKMRPVRGTKDLYPEDYAKFDHIISLSSKLANLYNAQEFSTPIFEYTEIFDRTLGESSDIVNKEMYSFLDRGGDSITLRPEFTAPVIRSIISSGKVNELPLRLFTYGPIFRYDRPQAGRQRQFHQINCEFLGEEDVYCDAELIKLANDILESLGILEDVTLEINSLGCLDSIENYRAKLIEYFSKYENDLSEDSRNRLKKNPLRILDSKAENDKEISKSAPKISDSYTKFSRDRFDQLLNMLSKMGVEFTINEKIVRGLDYYRHTAFEFTTNSIGAQSAVIGGGRYDGLAKIMSKYDFPGVGFGGGIERMMLLLGDKFKYSKKNIGVIPIGDNLIEDGYILLNKLREAKISAIMSNKGKIGKRIERAERSGSCAVIFVGEDEIKKDLYKLKILETGEEFELSLENIIKKAGSLI